jgi:hypothetical protein
MSLFDVTADASECAPFKPSDSKNRRTQTAELDNSESTSQLGQSLFKSQPKADSHALAGLLTPTKQRHALADYANLKPSDLHVPGTLSESLLGRSDWPNNPGRLGFFSLLSNRMLGRPEHHTRTTRLR